MWAWAFFAAAAFLADWALPWAWAALCAWAVLAAWALRCAGVSVAGRRGAGRRAALAVREDVEPAREAAPDLALDFDLDFCAPEDLPRDEALLLAPEVPRPRAARLLPADRAGVMHPPRGAAVTLAQRGEAP